jgi:hypothetical protein
MPKNIFNMHDFLPNTYQSNLNPASLPEMPEGATAFIDNSSIVDFGLINNFDEDLNQGWIESNIYEIELLTNETILDISELSIVDLY